MSGVSALAVAVLLGGGLAAGVLVLLTALPRWRAASLVMRIAPYVRDVVGDDVLPQEALPRPGVLPAGGFRPLVRGAVAIDRMLGGSDGLDRRLAQAGSPLGAVAFRGRQLAWTLGGVVSGALVVIALVLAGRWSVPIGVIPLLGGAVAVVGYDMQLSMRVRARKVRLTEELPTTLEFLALCLSAGEGFLDAVRRVAGVGSGELTVELRRVVVEVGTGSPVADALGDMARRLELPGLTRAVDQVVAALEHGSPLAAVLRAQADDTREEAKRTLIEQAGRKEIFMLLPLVFLILPLSVVFAIYPGLFILRLGIG
ncbi:type II secretion system F family protein [Microbacterium sp. BLY]|uniref:type II secretion system F family protein n=1 Tax=Microbacterium sp. BLY TaxID=2823280 RepID=UPI001B32C40F|nr:type II secretion system F family protein [Microbacterium sp. BLY]MBP3979049.1 type II secretion system F family protein [Microbacterium sp. BLY]